MRATGWALCGHETLNVDEGQRSGEAVETASNSSAAPLQDMNGVATMQSDEQAEQQAQAQLAGDLEAEAARDKDNHVVSLTRSARMQLGQKCKRLIDFGRQQWMSSQGFQVLLLLLICNVPHMLSVIDTVVSAVRPCVAVQFIRNVSRLSAEQHNVDCRSSLFCTLHQRYRAKIDCWLHLFEATFNCSESCSDD